MSECLSKDERYLFSDRTDEIMWVRVFKEENGDEPKDKLYYHTDHLGSIVFLTDEGGKKSAEYEYSPLGEIL